MSHRERADRTSAGPSAPSAIMPRSLPSPHTRICSLPRGTHSRSELLLRSSESRKCNEVRGALPTKMKTGTFAVFPRKMAELGVDALVKAIRGEKMESLVDSGAALVTKDNMAQFK